MNKKDYDILKEIFLNGKSNQRDLAKNSGYSLGSVNTSIKNLIRSGFIDNNMGLTNKSIKEIKQKKPKNAIILAAGFGMRMVPINLEFPKGIIEVKGERLIERIIKQLHEVGIKEIIVVVGFMKECYEYLIDKYGVKLVVNMEYSYKNNLHSMRCVLRYLSNTYIVPCDIWCNDNPFGKEELYSWYMVNDKLTNNCNVKINRKSELIVTSNLEDCNELLGIAYLTKEKSDILKKNIENMCKNSKFNNAFWEEALFEKQKMILFPKVVNSSKVIEINTYEQLREFDNKSKDLDNEAIKTISKVFNIKEEKIIDIKVLKKGMTNRSFSFTCKNKKYIMRIPGEGTDQLINRDEEANVYKVINGRSISDNIVYINPKNGYKITEYFQNARTCDPFNQNDIKRCMNKLRKFHELKLRVKHEFDIFKQINFYESLWKEKSSMYEDYNKTKENILSLKPFVECYATEKVLTHIDAVPDNFLFIKDDSNLEETVRLIDWEYAGMQDPHVDIAMFCIYSLYNKEQIDNLIETYFYEGCSQTIKVKIYCYIAICGLLWSNWCEYKCSLGIEFGEYSLQQYRYAKEYYNIVQNELKKMRK